jgi:hypothetical protein
MTADKGRTRKGTGRIGGLPLMRNAAGKLLESFAGARLYYVDEDGSPVCPECATDFFDKTDRLSARVVLSGQTIVCVDCARPVYGKDGSAPALEAGGRPFESGRPDHE